MITGRRTFSAAMVNAIDLRNLLGATLVGEPPGEKPNSYQENDEMVLPRSKIVISYSTRYYTFLEPDADAVMPDQLIAPTFEAFRDRRDEPLEWVLKAMEPPKASGETFDAAYGRRDVLVGRRVCQVVACS